MKYWTWIIQKRTKQRLNEVLTWFYGVRNGRNWGRLGTAYFLFRRLQAPHFAQHSGSASTSNCPCLNKTSWMPGAMHQVLGKLDHIKVSPALSLEKTPSSAGRTDSCCWDFRCPRQFSTGCLTSASLRLCGWSGT